MTRDEWVRRTKRTFNRPSTQFQAVTDALLAYENAGLGQKTTTLATLRDAIAAWKRIKDDWTASIRNTDGACRELFDWVHDEEFQRGLLPAPDLQYQHVAAVNCYAYACQCVNAVMGKFGAPVPGGKAGQPVFKKAPGEESPAQYYQRLLDGIVEDGRANKKTITVARDGGVPDNPPVPGHNEYLVVMMVKPDGFHFLRRGNDGNWSHKNGGGDSEVETCVYDLQQQMYVPITDGIIGDMLRTNQTTYSTGFEAMTFRAYLRVPDGGVEVKG